jgi:hypothetical protein
MSDWFGLSQLTSKSMLLEGRRAALIPQLHYYESGNSWQWEFLEVCWKFPGKFTDFACFLA